MGGEQRGGCGGGGAQLDGGEGTMGGARRTLALYCATVGVEAGRRTMVHQPAIPMAVGGWGVPTAGRSPPHGEEG